MSTKKNIIICLSITIGIVFFMLSFIYSHGSASSTVDLVTLTDLVPTTLSNPLPTITETPASVGQVDIDGNLSTGFLDLPSIDVQGISQTNSITLTADQSDLSLISTTLTSPVTSAVPTTLLLPFIHKSTGIPPAPTPIETVLFCDTLDQPLSIPDNNPEGVSNLLSITDDRFLVDMSVYLEITHQAVGDLVVTLTDQVTSGSITLLNRPGNQPNNCQENDVIALLDDRAIQPVNDQCAPETPAISGIYIPDQPLDLFFGVYPSGSWQLNISDNAASNVGSLKKWCMVARMTEVMPAPTPPPTPISVPDSAYIDGMTGQPQYYNLDCESRSAVDWARHYGNDINELDFFWNLPRINDDPEDSFVGAANGGWGQIPPNDYGVHAPPIADQLNDYGLAAYATKYLRWDELRAQIASGDPVIVWIIGDYYGGLANGIPHLYTPSPGEFTVVAPYEHTVVVVGYDQTYVQVLNGANIKNIPIDQFLDSWSVLQFMAVVAQQ